MRWTVIKGRQDGRVEESAAGEAGLEPKALASAAVRHLPEAARREPSVVLHGVSVGFPAHAAYPSIKNLIVGRFRRRTAAWHPILSDVDLLVRAGERVGLIGRNGSGKTTLLKAIAGIFPPQSGSRTVRGSITPIIAQSVGFDAALPVRLNIRLGLAYSGRLARYSAEFEQAILDFAELQDYADQPVSALSSGMQARLAFALTLFEEPDILMLDEVFATGDAAFVRKAEAAMLARIRQTPIVFIVSHSRDTILRVCTRCILLEKGRVVADGDPAAVMARYERDLGGDGGK